VLFASCKNPETELILTKNEEILRDCKACGQRSIVDMRHKLTTFILKNPPKKSKKRKEGTAEANVGGGPVGGDGSPGDRTPENGEADGAESDDELTRRIKAEAAELEQPAIIATDDWSADTSPEAVKARMKELEANLKNNLIVGDDDSDEDGDSPYTQMQLWVAEHRDDAKPAEVFKKAQELGIEKKHKTVMVLAQSLFTENIVKEIEKFAPLFQKVCPPPLLHSACYLHVFSSSPPSATKSPSSAA